MTLSHRDARSATAGADALAQVIRYHQETKHHLFRYARSLGFLDWANQPDPFRRYAGAPLVRFPLLRPDEAPMSPLYEDLYCPGAVPSSPVTLQSLSRFFEYALALSAWKKAGQASWALRSNPSSGNLHPTEGYVLMGAVPGLAPTPGLYHYAPKEHALERRADCPPEVFAALMKEYPPNAFLFGLSSVHWREAWKYGERAFRYCQHDAGHAIGAARFSAVTLGWNLLVLGDVADETVACLMGLNRDVDFVGAEREHPDCVAVVWPQGTGSGTDPLLPGSVPEERDRHRLRRSQSHGGSQSPVPLFLDEDVVHEFAGQQWYGMANRLSRDNPVPWEIIDEVAQATWKPHTPPLSRGPVALTGTRCILQSNGCPTGDGTGKGEGEGPLAGQIIRQRRSAVAFDGKTAMTAAAFFTMLGRVMPRVELDVAWRPMPWDAIAWEPCIHLGLFVHLVEGLPPGLYMLVRDPAKVEELRRAMHKEFTWAPVPGRPADLPLYLLQEGDVRQLAAQVSCGQDIAGDSAFALGMIAEFEAALRRRGPWFYRRLFWETGLIGQVLYLEAEAAGVRATGIGCFFDDPVHQVFGLRDMAYQSLYHFTTGGPVDDPRLTTLSPYGQRD